MAATVEARPGCTLILGYGNELRGDDGLGPYIVRALGRRQLVAVRTRIVHQLMPELAEDLSQVQRAVFVDAGRGPGSQTVELSRIETPLGDFALGNWSISHRWEPRVLVGLAQLLYGRAPQAWTINVTGVHFAAGCGLSARAERAAVQAVQRIERLLQQES